MPPAKLDLGVPDGMSQDEFDVAGLGGAPVAGLRMQWPSIIDGPRALLVAEERLPAVPEAGLLPICEGTLTHAAHPLPRPIADQSGQGSECGVERV